MSLCSGQIDCKQSKVLIFGNSDRVAYDVGDLQGMA